MIYFILSTLALVAIMLLWKRAKKPFTHKNISQEALIKFLEILLFRGYDTGRLFITIPKDKRFLQFSKYIDEGSSVGLRFDFPLAEWSRNYYEPLRTALVKAGFEFNTERTGNDKMPEFTVIDLKQDLKSALALAQLVLQEIYELNRNDRVELYFENVSPKEEKIGFE